VLLLHTGGTLGMEGSPLEPSDYASTLEARVPELGRLAEIKTDIVCNVDSSDMGPADWTMIARRIHASRNDFDGFVVVHGTDTMAYTAAALSFAHENLGMPIVLTGAQRPLSSLRTDARRNLQDAVEIAVRGVPEVGICFDGLFLRGCRAVKLDAFTYRAFASPGLPPLARLGVDVEVAAHVRRRRGRYRFDPRFDRRVAVLYVHPGLSVYEVRALATAPQVRGVVIAAYGVGTIPSGRGELADAIRSLSSSDTEVMVVTQHGGRVDLEAYRNSIVLCESGAIAGGSMRIEAAVPKLMHALAVFEDREERAAYLTRDVAGEHA
jgi:L-asparaginase